MMPGAPVVEAIRKMVASSFNTPGFKIQWTSEKPEFSPDGKLAFMRGTDEFTFPGRDGGPARTLHLHGVSVWRKDSGSVCPRISSWIDSFDRSGLVSGHARNDRSDDSWTCLGGMRDNGCWKGDREQAGRIRFAM
jgi:pentatricopeptide repeat protein